MERNKIKKILSIITLLTVVCNANAFAYNKDGNVGDSYDFNANTPSDTHTEDNNTAEKSEEENNRENGLTVDGQSRPDYESGGNQNWGGNSAQSWSETDGKGSSMYNPKTFYGGYSGWGLESKFTDFVNDTSRTSDVIRSKFVDNLYHQDDYYPATDRYGNEYMALNRTWFLYCFPTATLNKTYSADITSEDRKADYWTWTVEFWDSTGVYLGKLVDGERTTTSKFSYTPQEIGKYKVTSVPHQHIWTYIWREWAANCTVSYSTGYSEVVCDSSGTTPPTCVESGTDRPDLAKTWDFNITAAEVGKPFISRWGIDTDYSNGETKGEYETSLIN